MTQANVQRKALRSLPSVDELLRTTEAKSIVERSGERHAVQIARNALETIRNEILAGRDEMQNHDRNHLLARAESLLESERIRDEMSGTRRVINATGVMIHTNLGRAPLSDSAKAAIADASGYCALEYDILSGKRGKRGARAERLLVELTGAEDVLIVNNCAAAAFFVLNVFAAGGEVVISRGEMVEIGGDFRVPDVLSQSGATLREVGTTNRTKLADYEKAINDQTRVMLRVHPSNYRIVGFTAMPGLEDLSRLALDREVLLYEDIGSGALTDLSELGLGDEPVVSDSIAAGVDVVTFSGDKLVGGPQAGIIAGKAEYIERLRKNPLYRALRVDKLTYAALEATLEEHRRGTATRDIPALRMMAMTKAEIAERAKRLIESVTSGSETSDLRFELVDGMSAIGGGAAPNVALETTLIAVSNAKMSASKLEFSLRNARVPVITRIVDDKVMIDLRTVEESDERELLESILRANPLTPKQASQRKVGDQSV